jgi:polysaccharide biosynthesis/export protein
MHKRHLISRFSGSPRPRFNVTLIGILSVVSVTGCYAPLRSPATPAACLSKSYRMPERTFRDSMNLADLAVAAPADYILGPNDTLEVSVAGLSDPGPNEQVRPMNVMVMANGKVRLPLVGEVHVSDLNLSQAQQAIDEAYAVSILKSPKTSVVLAEKQTFNIPVMGEVTSPGVHPLPKFQNDIANAVAAAGGLTPFAAEVIEVHRRMPEVELVHKLSESMGQSPIAAEVERVESQPRPFRIANNAQVTETGMLNGDMQKVVLRIPLKSGTPSITFDNQTIEQRELRIEDITLRQGDVVVVPRQPDEVFFVVGPLNNNAAVNFRVSDLDRRLGNAFLLPKDRDVDVVTAVAMAGYIDPIESPTTVSVHRSVPGAPPMLIRVDLIAARYDWKENVYVQPGDIIYLNPDAGWWSRRMFDRVAPELLLAPYREASFRWINPRALAR